MIVKGAITQRANDERLPAATIERDYVLGQLCADIGARGDSRLVFKGGTLLRLAERQQCRDLFDAAARAHADAADA